MSDHDFEQTLRDRLDRRARGVRLESDRDDLDARIARARHRRVTVHNAVALGGSMFIVVAIVLVAYVTTGSTPVVRTQFAPTASTVAVPPSDAAARAAIVGAFTTVFQPGASDAARLDAIDDPTGMAKVFAQIHLVAPRSALATVRVYVDDVRFDTRVAATVDYTITSTDTNAFPGKLSLAGGAVFQTGRWKITRKSFCQAIAVGKVYCPEDAPHPTTTSIAKSG